MLTACFRRTAILFLLAAVLVVPWAAASPRIEGRTQPVQALEPSLPDWLSRFWGFLQKAWSKEGCHVDPNGQCSSGPAQPTVESKTGCGVDPDGQCSSGSAQPTVQPKTGCIVDPNGLCKP